MSDRLTILRSQGLRMCKLIKADGTIEPYAKAKNFRVEQREVDGIEALSALLVELESQPNACLVRGAPRYDNQPTVRRLAENFVDTPLHSLLIEIDAYRPLVSDPVTEPVDSAEEYLLECLPPEFRDVSYHYQLSNSAGTPGKGGTLRLHLWMWLTNPYDSATLKAWAKAGHLQLDHSVFQIVQPNFTAAPMREPGVADPVPQRSGFVRKARDSVDLHIDVDKLNIRPSAERLRGEGLASDDPLADFVTEKWETWGTLPNGGILVSCPWSDSHSSGANGDTSSCYFPAGSNGYPTGAYVCLHASCDERHLSDFRHAVGYGDRQLAALAEEPQVNGHALNGHVVDLPGFKRDAKGSIEATVNNIRMAVAEPRLTGMQFRYDRFKDEIVTVETDATEWRPFKDVDYTTVRLRLEDQGFKSISDGDLRSIIHWYADQNKFDTAKWWLDSLQWDGIPRIETFWIEFFGVPDDEAGYARAVGLYTWTALAARATDPGVQADMVPVLVGPQGVGKSRGVAAMSPVADFSTSMSFHEQEVERARKMRGKLVVELAELQGLKSREREEILAWITRSVEHWTPKFMEMSTTFARRFICFATTNDDDFLDNPNGERRWLPLAIGQREGFAGVDVRAIAALCEQLWAEGKARYAEGGIAWRDAERLARAEHGRYKAEDTWGDAVSRWLDHPDMAGETPRRRKWLTLHEVAEGALSMPTKFVKFSDQRRLGRILREEGYALVPRKINGKSSKVWVAGEG